MKKKFLSFIFAICLCVPFAFLLTACGGDGCQHEWYITRQPSIQETGATACSKCGQDGFDLPKLNDTDYEVEGTNPDYKIYKYTKDGKTYEAVHNNFEVVEGVVQDYFGSSANIVIPKKVLEFKGETIVTTINGEVFKDNTNITSVTLPESISHIGNSAFSGCTNLASISLPDGVRHIGNYAFADTALTSVVVPSGITTIGASSFEGCNSLQEITIPFIGTSNSMQSQFGTIFGDANSNSVVPSSLKKVTITGSDSEKTVFHWSAFEDCASIEEVIIGDNVSSLGNRAFYNCTSLKKIVLGSSITSFSWNTFYNCTSIEEVVLSSSFVEITGSAFANCQNLTEIIIPQSVTFIHGSAFENCTSLENIYYMGNKAQWNEIDIPDYAEYGLQNIDVYYYSETQPTGLEYINNDCQLNMWHYNENNEKVLWTINETNNVDNKTFVYAVSQVDLSDEYWYMLEQAEAQGMLGMLFDNDTEQIEMVTGSANKAEYEGKLAIYYASYGSSLSVAFVDGKVTLQTSQGSVQLDYVEVDGEVYYIVANNPKAFIYDATDGGIYEELVSEYFTIRHIYTLDN